MAHLLKHSTILNTVSMKLVLLSVVCLIGAVLAAPASTKQKRDILPGDPRYGTDYHHNHHHHHHHEHHPHENEVEISQAIGSYAGSYTAPENTGFENFHNFQAPQGSYGPPHYKPGKPINYPEIHQTESQFPSFNQQTSFSSYKPFESVESVNNEYLSPVAHQSQHPQVPAYHHHHIAPQNNAYLAPVVPTTQTPVVHYTTPTPVVHYTTSAPVVHYTTPAPVVHYTTPAPVVHYTTPAPVVHYTTSAPSYHHHVTPVNNGYLAPAIHAAKQSTVQPINSYGAPVPEYQAPAVQPAVENDQHYNGVVVKSHAEATNEESSDVYAATAAPVQNDGQTVEDIPVQQAEDSHDETAVQDTKVEPHRHVETETHSEIRVQHETAKTVQAQVSQTQPAVQQQKTVQQAVHQPISYHSAPQTFSSGYFGSAFDNFGTFDSSSFETAFGSPNYQISSGLNPQTYSTDLTNLGFGYQQGLDTSVFQQNVQTPHTSIQLPTFSQQYPQTIQSNVELPTFGKSQISQSPAYQGTSHFQTTGLEHIQQGQVQSSVHLKSNVQTSGNAHHQQTQLIGSNGGYVY